MYASRTASVRAGSRSLSCLLPTMIILGRGSAAQEGGGTLEKAPHPQGR